MAGKEGTEGFGSSSTQTTHSPESEGLQVGHSLLSMCYRYDSVVLELP